MKDNVPMVDTALPNIIELKNIKQTYNNGTVTVIEGLNLLIEESPGKGILDVILGPSGCGKSTLLRYISGIQKPSRGDVLLYGKPRDQSTHVGMVFQQYSSFPWSTVLDNVAFPLAIQGVSKKEREGRAMEMIDLVGLQDQWDKYAKAPDLSGGQLQRVAIARSLVGNPHILLMDEPFGALDTNTRLKAQDLLLSIWEKLTPTIIFITHDIPEAVYLGHDVYIMSANPGRLVEHFAIDLPFDKTRQIKRDPKFMDYVHLIEDKMIEVQSGG